MYNRQKRVEEDKQKKNILEEKYRVQKRKTQYMIKEAITAHERKITMDIRNNKGHKKLWDIVNTLRGKKRNTDKEEYIYDDQHNKIEAKQLSNEITNFWRQIYQRHENQISLEWNTEKRDKVLITLKQLHNSRIRRHTYQLFYMNTLIVHAKSASLDIWKNQK